MSAWALVLVCAVGPLVWAVAVARIIERRDRRKTRFTPPERPPTDYSI